MTRNVTREQLGRVGASFAGVESLFEPVRDGIEIRARRKQFGDSALLEFGNVVVGDDPATEEDHVVDAAVTQFLLNERKERHVGAGKDGKSDSIGIFLNCRGHNLLRSLEQTGVNHLEARISQGAGDNFRTSIVAIKARLGNHDAVSAIHRGFILVRCHPAKTSPPTTRPITRPAILRAKCDETDGASPKRPGVRLPGSLARCIRAA